jgi:hypothetical protein
VKQAAFYLVKYAIIYIISIHKGAFFMSTLTISLLVSLVIIIFVIIIFAAAITKGYSYKHTVDTFEDNPYLKNEEEKPETEANSENGKHGE